MVDVNKMISEYIDKLDKMSLEERLELVRKNLDLDDRVPLTRLP